MLVGRDTQQDSPNSRITSHSKCQRIYNKQQIVSDSFHLRHSSEIVTMSQFPQSPCVNESVLFIMNRPHQASDVVACVATSRRRSRSRAARRSPRCCRPSRPEWKRVVVGQWASHLAASAQSHRNRRSRIGETRHLQHPARAYHALRPHCTQLHPRMCLLQTKGGEAQCRLLSQGRILYTMVTSAAVLARRLIGTC